MVLHSVPPYVKLPFIPVALANYRGAAASISSGSRTSVAKHSHHIFTMIPINTPFLNTVDNIIIHEKKGKANKKRGSRLSFCLVWEFTAKRQRSADLTGIAQSPENAHESAQKCQNVKQIPKSSTSGHTKNIMDLGGVVWVILS